LRAVFRVSPETYELLGVATTARFTPEAGAEVSWANAAQHSVTAIIEQIATW